MYLVKLYTKDAYLFFFFIYTTLNWIN